MVDKRDYDTRVLVFEDVHACNAQLAEELGKYAYEIVVLGLDCEWVSEARSESSPVCPVALLQLAFPNGRCFLVRLCQMNGKLPDKLREILEDRNILKAGVGIGEDAKKVSSCYGVVVQGCVDLRHVASRCRGYVQHCFGQEGARNGMSLSALSQQILGIALDKDWRIRCSDWEASSLSERQIQYAADDAIVAVRIFITLAVSKLKEKEERCNAGNGSTLNDTVLCQTEAVLVETDDHERNITSPEDKGSRQDTKKQESTADIDSALDNISANNTVLFQAKAAIFNETVQGQSMTSLEDKGSPDTKKQVLQDDNDMCGDNIVLFQPAATTAVVDETGHKRSTTFIEDVGKNTKKQVSQGSKQSTAAIGGEYVSGDNTAVLSQPATTTAVFNETDHDRNMVSTEHKDSKGKEEQVSVESACEELLFDKVDSQRTNNSDDGVLYGLLSKLSEFSLGSMFVAKAGPKVFSDRKSKVYPQYPNFKNLEVTKELLASAELWNCFSSLCQGIVDVPFKMKSKQKSSKGPNAESGKPGPSGLVRDKSRGLKPRRAPLYQNCVIDAPDGERLSTCDKKKALWYLSRDLADVVKEDPYTIRLRFEPSGRPLDPANNYYLTFKENLCVSCGRDDSYMRKNVIPHDYRKHFPSCMKDHHSHDVLLLCPPCHMMSTLRDDLLRKSLAAKYHAPLGNQASSQVSRLVQDPVLKKVKSAAKALVHAGEKIPAKRREELLSTVKEFLDVENPTHEMMVEASEMETRQENCGFISHGREVVRKVKDSGELLGFERMWREHFLETMKPKFLPPLWTVDHEQAKVKRLLLQENN